MIKKKILFKNIFIFLCLVPMLVLSLFCLVPKKQNLKVSAADQVLTPYSFVGSNITTVASMYSPSGTYDCTSMINVSLSFTYNNGVLSASINGAFLDTTLASSQPITYSGNFISGESFRYNVYSSGYNIIITIFRSTNIITQNINRVSFTSRVDGSSAYNDITYYDTDNNNITFRFHRFNSSSLAFFDGFDFVDRTYYLNLLQMDNNTYYDAGYTDGYNRGVADGSDSGYTDGYNAGQTIGYDNGYSAGLVAGGDHTFMSLIGAVIDAPVSAFTSLLNFELLGVNLLGFITGLLTLAIIIFIIKLCLGGK